MKAGQVQLAIEKFLTLNLDLEADRVGNEGINLKRIFHVKNFRIEI